MFETAVIAVILLIQTDLVSAEDTTVVDFIEQGRFQIASRLIREDPDRANQVQADGTACLHWAVHHDEIPLVKLLIVAGVDVRVLNDFGVAAASLAARNGNEQTLNLLISAGADPETVLPGGESLLMTAARTGRPSAVKLLLDQDVQVDRREPGGQTALMWAASEGHADVVELLLNAGADSSIALDSGFSAFFFAVRAGRTEVVELFLKRGMSVHATMKVRKRPKRGAKAGMAPLLLAIENGHFELADRLLEAGADPNDQRTEYAPLHALCWVRKPNRGDGDDGIPAPIGSGKLTSLDIASRLVEHGADVDLRLRRGRTGKGRLSHRGATPFLLAADTADAEYLRHLISLGANPTICNAEGCSPLLAAAGVGTMAPGEEAGDEQESIEALKYLLSLGADINAIDENGETAMHGAAYKNLPGLVLFLAKHGCQIKTWNRPNRYGWSPLTIAEGYRFGNFRPAAETRSALHDVLRAAGMTPPESSLPTKPIEDDRYRKQKTDAPKQTGKRS